MKRLLTPVKVGLVVAASVLGLFYGLHTLQQGSFSRGDTYRVHAMLRDVLGVAKRSRVLMAGIEVGYIDSLELVGDRARLNLRIQKDVALFRDASLAKVSQSLLGDKLITLSPGTPSSGPLGDGGEIKTVIEEADFNTAFRKLDDITGDIRTVTQGLGRLIADIERDDSLAGTMRRLSEIADNVAVLSRQVSATLEMGSGKIEQILGDVAGVTEGTRARYKEILENIQAVTADVRVLVGNLNEIVGRGEEDFKDSVGGLKRTLDKATRSLENLDSITRKIDDGQGTLGRLVNDDQVLDKLEGILDDASSLTSPLARLQTIVDVRAEYQPLASLAKYYVGLKLVPRSDKFYMIELIKDPRGSVDVTKYCTSPDVCTETITVRDEMKFSLQIGKRFSWLGLRMGIIEDTGGVGADAYLFEDDVQLKLDVFGLGFDEFGREAYPRLKLMFTYRPTWLSNHVYLALGADDIINDAVRLNTFHFFFGAGISFNDEDLKALFTTVGVPKL